MLSAVIERASVERGDVDTAACGHIAIFTNLSIVTPAAFASDIGMTYLMAAPMSGRSFRLLTDNVLPRIAT